MAYGQSDSGAVAGLSVGLLGIGLVLGSLLTFFLSRRYYFQTIHDDATDSVHEMDTLPPSKPRSVSFGIARVPDNPDARSGRLKLETISVDARLPLQFGTPLEEHWGSYDLRIHNHAVCFYTPEIVEMHDIQQQVSDEILKEFAEVLDLDAPESLLRLLSRSETRKLVIQAVVARAALPPTSPKSKHPWPRLAPPGLVEIQQHFSFDTFAGVKADFYLFLSLWRRITSYLMAHGKDDLAQDVNQLNWHKLSYPTIDPTQLVQHIDKLLSPFAVAAANAHRRLESLMEICNDAANWPGHALAASSLVELRWDSQPEHLVFMPGLVIHSIRHGMVEKQPVENAGMKQMSVRITEYLKGAY